MDTFSKLNSIPAIKKVSYIYGDATKFSGCFFICPKMGNKGIRVNSEGTGFISNYSEKPSQSTTNRIDLVQQLIHQTHEVGIGIMPKPIFADADPLILFPISGNRPICPNTCWTRNYGWVSEHFELLHKLYMEEPWNRLPRRIVEEEVERLRYFLPTHSPENLKKDFVRRALAGFAMDGIFMRESFDNPIILGVESPGVAMLQNSALPREKWIGVVQLV